MTEQEILNLQVALANAESEIRSLKGDIKHLEKMVAEYREAVDKTHEAIKGVYHGEW